ncbi:MAG: hypothetical protein JWM98_1203 [Thermoleophilia bacterium]|nr:hypothetical protein [Thermoleophilia bacterium]
MLTTAALAAAGVFLGGLADLRLIGGLAGGVLGTVLGFILVWQRYVVPANEEDRARDYSRVRKFEDDDDDDW